MAGPEHLDPRLSRGRPRQHRAATDGRVKPGHDERKPGHDERKPGHDERETVPSKSSHDLAITPDLTRSRRHATWSASCPIAPASKWTCARMAAIASQ